MYNKNLTAPGKAQVRREATGLLLTVAPDKNVFAIGFLIFWLCGWALGEFGVIAALFFSKKTPPLPVIIFMLIWLTGWTFGGYMALKTVLFMMIGRQEILFSHKNISIAEKIGNMGSPKIYPADDITGLAVKKIYSSDEDSEGHFAITFEHNGKPVEIGSGLDQNELQSVLDEIRMSGYLPSKLCPAALTENEEEDGFNEGFEEEDPPPAEQDDEGVYRVTDIN